MSNQTPSKFSTDPTPPDDRECRSSFSRQSYEIPTANIRNPSSVPQSGWQSLRRSTVSYPPAGRPTTITPPKPTEEPL